ncbi:DnaJ-domain-containing protein [Tuber magnatum]|uniref:Diphthamide biosynthesis protein 4 n=1 Tax=Tuber magnatum TaxID=42249 RepID=A0A317SPJ2_9PEZI|nr:DnaJ-domain-containing protein [Tuber magnatum]
MSPRQPTHYEILSLPPSLQNLTSDAVRRAYHKALLHHHPDKSPSQKTQLKPTFSIDQIATAFTVLSDPDERRKYDRDLWNVNAGITIGKVLQTVDLDDMEYCEEERGGKKGVWWRGCRCGEERGFVLTEEDLEDGEGKGEDGGEVVVGCVGCSLWVRVVYGVVLGEEEGEEKE